MLDSTAATLAHHNLVTLPIDLYPYLAAGEQVWQLRHNLTAHDAAYVATAEQRAAELVALGAHLARAPGPHCTIQRLPANAPCPSHLTARARSVSPARSQDDGKTSAGQN